MDVDDRLLMSYVDGELSADERAAAETTIAASKEVAARVAALRASRLPYRAAFEHAQQPAVPASLIDRVEALTSVGRYPWKRGSRHSANPEFAALPAGIALTDRTRHPDAIADTKEGFMEHGIDERRRWLALILLCFGVLMIVLDTTIVNVALPSIRADLGFTETSLVWVVNAYMLTFGGFLLLGGRLGDLFGHRRLFLLGIGLFTLASTACGLANSQGLLIAARAVQGVAGAVVSAVSLSLIMNLFTSPADRAKAMGVYGFVCASGGSIGVLLGGLLTSTLSWHWIFLVNVPIGIGVYAACLALLPAAKPLAERAKLDVTGALAVTTSLMFAVYAVVHGNETGWTSAPTLAQLGVAVGLMLLFLIVESRVSHPLMPLRMFALRNVATANVVGVLWAAAMFAWFFISALYLQRVLNYSAMKVGLAFLPANIIMAVFSLGLSAKLVMRFGIRAPLAIGLLVAALGLASFARAPVDGSFAIHVLPGMILLGLGAGVAFNPVLLAAMNDVAPDESGLASGVVNTSFMMGGALGLAILASLAAARTDRLAASGAGLPTALNGGYHLAFLLGAIAATLAAALAGAFVRTRPHAAASHADETAQSVSSASR